jgi:hypothetical protein
MKRTVLPVVMLLIAGICLAGPPRPRENKFMKMEAAGIVTGPGPSGPQLVYSFTFSLKRPLHMTRVRVEDVTNKSAVLLVDDHTPKVAGNLWNAGTRAAPLTPENFPWMFEDSKSLRVFRVTVSAADQPDIILEQPAIYPASAKKVMIQAAAKTKKGK